MHSIETITVDRRIDPRSDHIKEYKICICWFSDKHAPLRRRTDWLARNQDNVSECGYMSTH